MVKLMNFFKKIIELIIAFKLFFIIVGFIISFFCGYLIAVPKCRSLSRQGARVIRKFEQSDCKEMIITIKCENYTETFYFDKEQHED